MRRKVVITGMGVCAPNGIGLDAFGSALAAGKSGIRFIPKLAELGFGCQIAGQPQVSATDQKRYFTPLQEKDLNASGLIYGTIAGMDAWKDANLAPSNESLPDWDSGVVFGTGILGVDKFREAIYKVDEGQVRRLGSTTVVQTMASGISAHLGGVLGCGNQVTSNSSACTTGTEALLMGFDRIANGRAERMLVGSCSDSGPYIWGGFDAMRILPRKYNDDPGSASRPMSATATGFVPGSGAGALVLESLESARARGVRIYAEVLGGSINSGGHRNGGSMTAPNNEGVRRCIQDALANAGVSADAIDAINGHLTATSKDAVEIRNWSEALGRNGTRFPLINSFKGVVGHCLAAAGSIECVGTVLQLVQQKVFSNVNCHDVHPDILPWVHPSRIPLETKHQSLSIVAKASFGFGDVNACVLFKTFSLDAEG